MRTQALPLLAALLLLARCNPATPEPVTEETTPQKRYSGPEFRPTATYPDQPEAVLTPVSPLFGAYPRLGRAEAPPLGELSIGREAAPEPIELGAHAAPFYPTHQDLFLVALHSEGTALTVTFASDRPGFEGVAFGRVEGGVPTPELGLGSEVVWIDLSEAPSTFNQVFWFQAVDRQGARGPVRQLGLSLYTAEFYAARGLTAPSVIIIDWTEIPPARNRVEDWIVDRPSFADRRFAEATFGERVRQETTTTAQIQALAVQILEAVALQVGVPSEALSALPPFEQFQRAAAGQDQLWCDNYAKIFVRAANSLGIPARRIELLGHCDRSGPVAVCTADGHATTEYFDRELNRWVWIDLTGWVLGARNARGDLLDAQQFQRAFNDPLGEPVTLELFDPHARMVNPLSVDPREPRWGLKRFFNPDQTFRYYRRSAKDAR